MGMSGRRGQYVLVSEEMSEHAEQRTMNKVLTMEVARAGHISPQGVVWFSLDQSNSHDTIPAIRVGRGICAGVPDVLFLFQGRAYWCELKSRDGVVSDPQRSMAASLLLAGCRIGIACSAEEVLALLDQWQIPRRKLIKAAA
jgi:hypothetical protein